MKTIKLFAISLITFSLISCEHELLGDATHCGCKLAETYAEDTAGDEEGEYHNNLDLIGLRSELDSFLDEGVSITDIQDAMKETCPEHADLLEKAMKSAE